MEEDELLMPARLMGREVTTEMDKDETFMMTMSWMYYEIGCHYLVDLVPEDRRRVIRKIMSNMMVLYAAGGIEVNVGRGPGDERWQADGGVPGGRAAAAASK